MKTTVSLLFIVLSVSVFAQKSTENEYYADSPGVIIGKGVSFYSGNFTGSSNISSLKSSNKNFNIEYFHPVTDVLVLRAGFLKNSFNYWDVNSLKSANVNSRLSSFNLSVNYRFDNDVVIKKKVDFSPFIGLGFGIFSIKTSADYLSENGDSYYYWSDGTIRNSDETLSPVADTIYRDYVYESNISDSLNSKVGIQSFLELGVALKVSKNVTAQISYKKMLLFNDFMSGVTKIGKNDNYGYVSFGIGVNFGGFKKTIDEKEIIEESETLSVLDEDKDGVVDFNDKCAHSPEKVEVGKDGCPLDTDKDGVPDYKDVELKSPNIFVNEVGKSYTEEELEVIYLLKTDAIAGHERYDEFRKKYPELFKKFNQDSETLEHKSESN